MVSLKDPPAISRVSWFKALVYGLLFAGIYYSAYTWLILKDWARDDYSASILIPLVVVYLIWEERKALSTLPSAPTWTGVVVLATGIMLFWLGELAGEFFTLYLSSWVVLVGLCWLHLGWNKLKVIRLPLILCLAMFPLPNLVHGKISLKLKLISSHLGVKIMQWLGISAYREGNVIDLGVTQLQVVDACNGLRYLIPLIILGFLFAHFFKAHWWKRVALVLSTIPIAVVVNSLRIALVGIFYPMFGARVVEGFFHDFSGWFIFMLTVGLLLVVMWVLRYLPPKQKPGEAPVGDRSGGLKSETSDGQRWQGKKASSEEVMHDEGNGFFWRKLINPPQFIVACCLLLGTLALSHGIDFREKVQTSTKLDQFPLHLGTWNGITKSMDQRFIETLDLSDYSIIDFKDASGKEVNLYIAFYESQRKGESIHSPATCLPGGGWLFNQEGKALIPLSPAVGQKMPVNRALMKKGDTRQISYFWFPMRGRILTNAWELKLYNFWDALTRQRTDGALVRLITPLYPGEDVADADKRLVSFTQAIVPVLNEYLPK